MVPNSTQRPLRRGFDQARLGRGRASAWASAAAACCVWVLLSAGIAWAGDPSFDDRKKFGAGQDATVALAAGDIDGDGHLDLIVGNDRQQSAVYLNDGAGNFFDGTLGRCADAGAAVRCFGKGIESIAAVAVGDVNGDDALDIVAGTNGQGGYIYINVDRGQFAAALRFGPPAGRMASVALGDVDGDADLDIVAVGGGSSAVYLNDGAGGFYAGALDDCATAPDNARCFGGGAVVATVALGDMDGRAGLDLVLGSNTDGARGGQSAVYLNDGTGRFANESPDRCVDPAQAGKLVCFGAVDAAALIRRVVVGDLDGQAGLDIAASYDRRSEAVYLNAGADGFREVLDWSAASALTVGGPVSEESGAATPSGGPSGALGLALADLDANGALDVIVGRAFEQNVVYLNDGSGRALGMATFGTGFDATTAVVAADLDSDGDLDLAVANKDQRSAAYLNDGTGRYPDGVTVPGAPARAVALGDMDHDGSLDIVVSVDGPENLIYLNNGMGQFTTTIPFGRGRASALAIGDVDEDLDLDVIAGYSDAPLVVYLNEARPDGRPQLTAAAQPFGSAGNFALALGDLDGDGDLDVVAGRDSGTGEQFNYLNDGRGNFSQFKMGRASHHTRGIALGDLDGDGDLDVVAGNSGTFMGEREALFLNDGVGRFDAAGAERTVLGDPDSTNSVALGDIDADGDLDLVVGNGGFSANQNLLYLNTGAGPDRFSGGRSIGTGKNRTLSVALADVDGDGDLDLIVGQLAKSKTVGPSNKRSDVYLKVVYLNDGRGNFPASREFAPTQHGSALSAVGDLDGDGAVDFVSAGAGQPLVITFNPAHRAGALANRPGFLVVARPDSSADAPGYSSAVVLSRQQIRIPYALFDPEGTPVRRIAVEFSPDGGGQWLPAVPTTDTLTATLSTIPAPRDAITHTHVYTWDTFASGFFDQSDTVALRIKAYPSARPGRNGLPDAGQWPYASATTNLVRVLGTQVQVFRETGSISNTVAGARVFRLPAGRLSGGALLGSAPGQAYRTNPRGFLQGGGQIMPGDRLVALWPVTATYSYTLYYTSALPVPEGLQMHEVMNAGVQRLVVSEAHPLVLFNLDISLEWDARNDGAFLDELREAVLRASEVFYDATDGQMALGQVRIFQNKEHWLASDVVIYANASVRPRATMGGVVTRPTNDVISATKVITDAFWPGQIRMGPAWDPFGENRSDLGRDWWRAFAHEFGHYLLYLPDNYLGYDPAGVIRSVDCRYSFMTNTYDDRYSEYINVTQWRDPASNCDRTVAALLTGRSDWETIKQFYPMVQPGGENSGPAVLPVNVTEISFIEPLALNTALPARYFDLRDAAKQQRLVVAQGQGYLFKQQGTSDLRDDRVIPLGSTGRNDRLRVRGAAAGDRVCVFDESHAPPRLGCQDDLNALSTTLYLQDAPGWVPNIVVQPLALPAGMQIVTHTVPITSPVASPTPDAPTPSATPVVVGPVRPPSQPGAEAPTQPVTPTRAMTETVAFFRPALAITVTLAQPISQTQQLNLQVLPAYEPAGAMPRVTAPWATVPAVDPANPITFTQVMPLDARFGAGFVRVWVSDTIASRVAQESIVQFFVGSQWGQDAIAGAWTDSRGGQGTDSRGGQGTDFRGGQGTDSRGGQGTDSRGGQGTDSRGGQGTDSRGGQGADDRAWSANRRAFGAPIASSDGQVTVFNRKDVLADTGTASLQALAGLPNLPGWLTPVGQGYRFVASAEISRTLAFDYLQREVPPGYEHTLQIYYLPDAGTAWRRLPTELDLDENMATAPADASGLYILAASVEIPLYATGWNLFAFPVPETRAVTEALRSIDAQYRTIFTYDSRDAADPWKVYDKDAPAWVNDLRVLEYGRGYWINVSAPITLQLQVAADTGDARPKLAVGAAELSDALGRRSPPAIYYGTITDGPLGEPFSAGMTLTAWIESQICGHTQMAQEADGRGLRYVIKVVAGEPGTPFACGAPGKRIVFTVGNQAVGPGVAWDNRRPAQWNMRRSAEDTTPPVTGG